ncbi:MAG: hypothetical protein HY556_11155 [Euryarchaeota archaeon]|nr:hypothetical protein [Euryarchaeota archaeon]
MNHEVGTMSSEFVISFENKPGTLAPVAKALGSANINIIGFSIQPQGEFGTFRFVTTTGDVTKTENWLKNANRAYRVNELVTVRTRGVPGVLGRLCESLSASGVNVEACYQLASQTPGDIEIAFHVDDVPSARKILAQ